MGIGYPPQKKQDHFDESSLGSSHENSLGGDEFSNDALSSALEEDAGFDGDETSPRGDEISVLSLLEENARLRGLVVKLSDLVLKNVADRN